jgi:hypothetical protein
MKDPIVEEVRRFRDEHSKRFNYDLDAICEDYKAHQVQVGSRLVRLKPKTTARVGCNSVSVLRRMKAG